MIKEILHPDIYYYKNIIPNPNDIVKEIEEMDQYQKFGSQVSKWETWTPHSNKDVIFGKVKHCYLNLFANDTDADRHNSKLMGMLTYLALTMAEEYAKDHDIELGYLPVYFGLNKYNVGVEMGPHMDSGYGADDKSTVSMVIYLNDDYEGGEIEFPDHNILLKPEAGSAVVFPSVGCLHDPKATVNGTKYMVPLFFFKR
jgi:hypothetical protein